MPHDVTRFMMVYAEKKKELDAIRCRMQLTGIM